MSDRYEHVERATAKIPKNEILVYLAYACGHVDVVCVSLNQRWRVLTLMLHHDFRSCLPQACLHRVGQSG